ncbi:DUF6427 family protein [Chryseobacterium sp. A301]
MFKLLSKESNIFSIPVYIFFLLVVVVLFNVLNFSYLDFISVAIAFCGVALGYFVFNQINLTYNTHLPLVLYTALIFAFYDGTIDIGISVTLFVNSVLLFLLTSTQEHFRKQSYLLVGFLCAVNYFFLPPVWPMLLFVILHIIATAQHIALNLFRFFFGICLCLVTYLSVMFFIGYTTLDPNYLPLTVGSLMQDYYPLYFLLPILLMSIYAIFDHFQHYNEKSPDSRFKYTFLLVFTLAQAISIVLYMGPHYEYLLVLAFPVSLILSRMLRYLPKYAYREIGLWVILICLLLYKGGTFFQLF